MTGMPDVFTLLIVAALAVVLYSAAVRFIPGMQPGEAKLNAILEHLRLIHSMQPAAPAPKAGEVYVGNLRTAAAAPTATAPKAAALLPKNAALSPKESSTMNTDYFARVSVAGQCPTDINNAVVALLQRGVLTLPDAMTILTPTRKMGAALIRLAEWGEQNLKADDVPAGTGGNGGGTVVVDVGDVGSGVGHGPFLLSAMSPANWAYYQQHRLGAKWADIFACTVAELNAAIGSMPGNLAQYGDGDPIVVGFGSLARWG